MCHAEKRVGGEEVEAAGVDNCFAKLGREGAEGCQVEGGLSFCVEVGSRARLHAEGHSSWNRRGGAVGQGDNESEDWRETGSAIQAEA